MIGYTIAAAGALEVPPCMATSRSERSVWHIGVLSCCSITHGAALNSLHPSATEYVKEAVAEDKAENYERALELYMHALEYFSTHLKYEKNPRSKEAITNKVTLSCMKLT